MLSVVFGILVICLISYLNAYIFCCKLAISLNCSYPAMMFLIALLSLAAVVRADPPHACCAPSPYTGVLLTIGGANPAGTDKVTFTDVS